MNANQVCTFVVDLKFYIHMKLNDDFNKLATDTEFNKSFLVAKEFLRKQGIINYVLLESKQKDFLKTCPCEQCKFNEPCEECGDILPFDPLNINGPYRMACRKNKHVCLKCKIS